MIMKIIDRLLFGIFLLPVALIACCILVTSFLVYFVKNVFTKK